MKKEKVKKLILSLENDRKQLINKIHEAPYVEIGFALIEKDQEIKREIIFWKKVLSCL